jgi:hypothetical protein
MLTEGGPERNSFISSASAEHWPQNAAKALSLLIQQGRKPRKKDALENHRTPERPDRSSPVPSPTTWPQSRDACNMNFFDMATSDHQLHDMSRAVPMPDANGYILGDEFLVSSSCMPLLVIVNSRSGPQQGSLLINQFRRLLNPTQVWDLAKGGPEKVLKSFLALSRVQILVCGSAGTVSWIISVLEGMGLERWQHIGILPLGTGKGLLSTFLKGPLLDACKRETLVEHLLSNCNT